MLGVPPQGPEPHCTLSGRGNNNSPWLKGKAMRPAWPVLGTEQAEGKRNKPLLKIHNHKLVLIKSVTQLHTTHVILKLKAEKWIKEIPWWHSLLPPKNRQNSQEIQSTRKKFSTNKIPRDLSLQSKITKTGKESTLNKSAERAEPDP